MKAAESRKKEKKKMETTVDFEQQREAALIRGT